MGCDIHVFLERKNKNKWEDANLYQRNYYKATHPDDEEDKDFNRLDCYNGRNYNLFAALADVRNHGYIKPINQPKGIPEDASKEVKKELTEWELDAHSISYFTLQELLDSRSNYQEIINSGFITKEYAKLLDEKNIIPAEWSQDVYENGIRGGEKGSNYVWREWTTKYDLLAPLIDGIINTLCLTFYYDGKKRVLENAVNFRIVFWFDN